MYFSIFHKKTHDNKVYRKSTKQNNFIQNHFTIKKNELWGVCVKSLLVHLNGLITGIKSTYQTISIWPHYTVTDTTHPTPPPFNPYNHLLWVLRHFLRLLSVMPRQSFTWTVRVATVLQVSGSLSEITPRHCWPPYVPLNKN